MRFGEVLVDKAEERTRNVRLDILAVWRIEPNDVSWSVPASVACLVIVNQQPSVALASYLEEVKIELAELELKNPKDNLNPAERETLNTLKRDTNINLKKADKGTLSVVLNIEDKIKEGQTQLDNREHYRPLDNPLY